MDLNSIQPTPNLVVVYIRNRHALQEQGENSHGGLAFVCFGRKEGQDVVESESYHRCTGLQVSTMNLYNCRNAGNKVTHQYKLPPEPKP